MKEPLQDIKWTDKKRLSFGIPISFTTYFLNDTKLVVKSGAVYVHQDEIDLYKITDKKIITSPLGRMCNYGSIVLYSRDTNNNVFRIENVKNVDEVSALLTELIDAQRDKYHIRGKDMYGSGYYTK